MLTLLAAGTLALSFADARELADARSGLSLAARAGVSQAQAGVSAAGQLANPTVTLSYGPDEPKWTGALDLRLPIFGQRGAAIDTAEAGVRVAQADLGGVRAKLHAQVRRTYFAAAAARVQARLASEAEALAAQLAQLSEARFRTGGAPRLEVEQAQLAWHRASQERVDRKAEAEATAQELAAALGIPGEAVQPAEAPVAVQVPALDELLRRAEAQPELASLRAQADVARARAGEERAAVRPLPTVNLTGQRYNDGSIGLRTGVAFDLPLLSLNRGKIAQQELAARGADAQAMAALQRVTGAVRAARARWAAAAARASFYGGDYVASAQRVLDMAQSGYRIGRTSLVAVLQAQGDLSAARVRAVDASVEAEKAVADLEEATGADL